VLLCRPFPIPSVRRNVTDEGDAALAKYCCPASAPKSVVAESPKTRLKSLTEPTTTGTNAGPDWAVPTIPADGHAGAVVVTPVRSTSPE
jgi:hypothetical protein